MKRCNTFAERVSIVNSTAAASTKSLVAICDRALRSDPAQRYADAGELERDIQAWLASDNVSAYKEPWWGTLDRLLPSIARSFGASLFVY